MPAPFPSLMTVVGDRRGGGGQRKKMCHFTGWGGYLFYFLLVHTPYQLFNVGAKRQRMAANGRGWLLACVIGVTLT